MINFNKEDLLKVAKLSALKLNDQEAEFFAHQLQTILSYVQQLQEVQETEFAPSVRNVNVMREDQARPCVTAADLRANAPEREGNFFVVPKILD